MEPRLLLRLLQHGEVDSTSERAFAALAAGTARHGDVHLAETQSAGRGRRGRAWASARGEGLYLSVVLLPASLPHPAALTMGAGLAVLEAAGALGAASARLKWPNDVLVADAAGSPAAKLAGILVEARGLDPARPHAVVGIGLNVRQRAFPPELEAERAVTSLARLGLERTLEEARNALLARLAPRLEEACEHPAASARAYAAALGLDGRPVRLAHGRGEVRGRLLALGLDGIELETSGGRARHLLEHVQALEALDLDPGSAADGARVP